MEAFTRRTGIQVKSFGGEAGPLFERLKAEGDRTPADVLISVDAGHLWNASRAGLLSKVDSPSSRPTSPRISATPRIAGSGSRCAPAPSCTTPRAKPTALRPTRLSGTRSGRGGCACARRPTSTTSRYRHHDQALRGAEDRGHRAGWVANNPTLINGDTKILEAVAAGQCDVALTNTYYLGRILAKDSAFPVAAFWANQQTTGTHVNISGAGVTTHAKNRAEAIKLIEFLTGPEAQQMFADSNFEFPANPQAAVNPVIAKWGKFKQDDTNVARPASSRPRPRGWRIGPATSSARVLAATAGSSLWAWTAIGIAAVVAVPIAAVLSSLAVPSGDVWRHLWRTQLLELIANTLLLLLGVGRARCSSAAASPGSWCSTGFPGARCWSGR